MGKLGSSALLGRSEKVIVSGKGNSNKRTEVLRLFDFKFKSTILS